MKSAFDTWFKAQYGAIPSVRLREKLADQVDTLNGQLHDAREQLRMQDALQDNYTAALYGWNAKGKEGEKK